MAANQPSSNKKQQSNSLQSLLHLSTRALNAKKPMDLLFTIVNETLCLTPYRQAAFFDSNGHTTPKLAAASGLVEVEENSPYTVWLNGFATTFTDISEPTRVSLSDAAPEHQESWQEWLPEHLLISPLHDVEQNVLGYIMYAREADWSDAEIEQHHYINKHYSYCLSALNQPKHSLISYLSTAFSSKKLLLFLAGLIALLVIPVRLSVLAPSEVIALNAFTVASPQEGVIQHFHVKPNAHVSKGDVLFTLDSTSINNRYEVAKKALATTKADALSAQQRAFNDIESRASLASARGRVKEKQAELAAISSLKSRIAIKAEQDGIAIFTDANDWIGRPVSTGERVMQIASPDDVGLLVWLPVHDAINIELGAPMKLFLNTQPLDSIEASLKETSYQASMSPDNIASYRIKGHFNEGETLPRIGLRGTTRITGEWSVLGYYIFRRPIAAIREWSGI